jgi:hypothetical protein
LSGLLLLAVSLVIGIPAALAQNDAPAAKKAAPAKKKEAVARKPSANVHEDDRVPDVSASAMTDYHCELGNKLTIYRNAEDSGHIALRWKKQLLRLARVETTTGANRFENRRNGWVWIDIPTKGMLLNSKKGQQLAQDCKSQGQIMPKAPDT